jgi:hypothetical protein
MRAVCRLYNLVISYEPAASMALKFDGEVPIFDAFTVVVCHSCQSQADTFFLKELNGYGPIQLNLSEFLSTFVVETHKVQYKHWTNLGEQYPFPHR